MSKTHLHICDRHNDVNSTFWVERALGNLIVDLKPDVVVDNGDGADMPSLCSYDRNTRSFQGRNYKADIRSANEGNDQLWSVVRRQKKKMPRRVTTIGNHEQRIHKALELSPELDGAVSFNDLQLDYFYDDVVSYQGSTPGIIEIDGVFYSHYLVSGVMARPIGGMHQAYTILAKHGASCVVGHSHTVDYATRPTIGGRRLHCVVGGTASEAKPGYAGNSSDMWWRGVTILHNVEEGSFDPEFVSLERLKYLYGE